jgi:hypothetical protein
MGTPTSPHWHLYQYSVQPNSKSRRAPNRKWVCNCMLTNCADVMSNLRRWPKRDQQIGKIRQRPNSKTHNEHKHKTLANATSFFFSPAHASWREIWKKEKNHCCRDECED